MNKLFSENRIYFLDGALGTVLQQKGLAAGARPELLNMTDPKLIESIQAEYISAGSEIISANTFGANALKLANSGYSVEEIVEAAVKSAKKTAKGRAKVALDIGPLGELLEPMGLLKFERAYELFAQVVRAGKKAGADLVLIETMTDLYETKAALLAVKENSDLPVMVTMSFEEGGRTFTGCNTVSMARTLEGLGADAIGLNCSIGPDKAADIIRSIAENITLPVIAMPNAGMPDPRDGHYNMNSEDFAAAILECIKAGASVVGGCCGTTPEYIRAVKKALEGISPVKRVYKKQSFLCTPVTDMVLTGVRVIGERINPTGKKRFQQALLENDMDYILDMAVQQEDAGADILDVNVGYPGVDEVTMLPKVVKLLQSVVSLPLQLDSSDPEALEAGLRVYNGKPVVNSVNGDPGTMERILPLIKKYGASVVGLTLDKKGIPPTAEGRIEIAKRILEGIKRYDIPREDLFIDCLTLTVSAQQEQAEETLRALSYVRNEMGLQTVLGVSNISFGLPNRELVTQTFLIEALKAGLTLPIINPNQRSMMDAVAAHRVLSGEDGQCRTYIQRFAEGGEPVRESSKKAADGMTLEDAIIKGLKEEAGKAAKKELETGDEIFIVENILIPALDKVGEAYEKGKAFLPQLLSAAQAAQAVFEEIRRSMINKGETPIKKGRIIIATVQGDIHDIGKNIVKTVLENYGYEMLDLGKDVAPELVLEEVKRNNIRLVGLSALMTTTLPAMEKTVRLLNELPNPPKTFVGGAVVTPEYARNIGASYYAGDARESVNIAGEVFGA